MKNETPPTTKQAALTLAVPELPPAIVANDPPQAMDLTTEMVAKAAEQHTETEKKRWRIADKLRNRHKRERSSEQRADRRRLERFRRNYDIAAHFIIDAIADTEKDEEKRDERRFKLERRMHVGSLLPVMRQRQLEQQLARQRLKKVL